MKTIRLTPVVFLLTMCQASFAQYDDDGYYHPGYDASHSSTRYSSYNPTYVDAYEYGWCNFYGEYSPLKNYTSAPGEDDLLFHTATIGFSYNYVIYQTPVTLELGFEASGSWYSERKKDGTKDGLDFYSGKIPLNIGFRLPVAEGFWIVPYGGINVKWNIYGEQRFTDVDGRTERWKIFSQYDMYNSDYNRWQLGYQAGVKLILGNCVSIGAAWKADITPFCSYYDNLSKKEEKERFRGLSFTLGYIF